MSLSFRELGAAFHGMVLGTIYLLLFSGVIFALWNLKPGWSSENATRIQVKALKIGSSIMAVATWLTVITGTYIVYPWYRAKPPEGITDLADYPRYYLLANSNLAGWHKFGMEWKEHIAWLAPILATAVAVIIVRHGSKLVAEEKIRTALIGMITIAFGVVGIAALLGAFITKAAPIH